MVAPAGIGRAALASVASTSGLVGLILAAPLAGEASLSRNETAVHVQALGILRAGRPLTVTLFAGPTFFNVTPGLVTDMRAPC